MTKALLKKQMMEAFSWLYFNRKNGEKRTKAGIIAYAVLYLFIFGMLGVMFFTLAVSLCEPLYEAGLGWFYFTLISLIAIVLGVFGSVFNTYATLYMAKDNDFPLSMPIPAPKILIMRLSGVYMMGLMYEMIVMIPALIVWFVYGNISILGIVFSILIPIVLSFFILTLSCILGWVVALVSSKIKNKSFITVALSLAFIFGYYYVYAKAYTMFTNLLMHVDRIADNVKNILYPFYHMGLAAEGSLISMLIFTGIIAAMFGIVYIVLSRSFIRLATSNKGTAKVKYKEKPIKVKNADHALLRKELKRFLGSAGYMLNCSLGTLFMLIAAAALIWKGDMIAEVLPLIVDGTEDMIPLFLTAMLCMMSSTNDITAPSISLEGKNLWLIQVLPVTSWQVLKAKIKLHLLFTIPSAFILTICAILVFKVSIGYSLLILIIVILFILTMALFGLFLNLKAPNLNWTNEIVPIKQSMSVTLAIFGGWGLVLAFGALYYVLRNHISPMIYLIIVCVTLFAMTICLLQWIKNKGTKLLETL